MIYLNVILTLLFLVLLTFLVLLFFIFKKYGKNITNITDVSKKINSLPSSLNNKQLENSMKMLNNLFNNKLSK